MFYLKRNLPHWERIVRLALAAGLAWLVWKLPVGGAMTWLAWASVAMLLGTAFVGFCPACALLGRRAVSKQA